MTRNLTTESTELGLGDDAPRVSIVVPMLNEAGSIERCLGGFATQTVGVGRLDVIIADGGSTDGSREWVERFSEANPWCRVVENPRRKASAAFNVGLREARGELFVLFSAHGEPSPDFVERSESVLRETGAGGVGGRCPHEGDGSMGQAIGLAMQSPFGMASPTRNVTRRREVDTIIHPMYLTDVARSVGEFDETLERNSDYEFNYRMRQAGHRLVIDPSIYSVYHPRGSLSGLGRQFWAYGRWKARVIRRHPGSMRPRHVAPALLVIGLATAPLWARSTRGRRFLSAVGFCYSGLSFAAANKAKPADHGTTVGRVALCFPVMHVTWGVGLLSSVAQDATGAGKR